MIPVDTIHSSKLLFVPLNVSCANPNAGSIKTLVDIHLQFPNFLLGHVNELTKVTASAETFAFCFLWCI